MKRPYRPIPNTVVHGKQGTYSNWYCRCDACRKANTIHVKNWRDRKKLEATHDQTQQN
jgi:hypothetical protein